MLRCWVSGPRGQGALREGTRSAESGGPEATGQREGRQETNEETGTVLGRERGDQDGTRQAAAVCGPRAFQRHTRTHRASGPERDSNMSSMPPRLTVPHPVPHPCCGCGPILGPGESSEHNRQPTALWALTLVPPPRGRPETDARRTGDTPQAG